MGGGGASSAAARYQADAVTRAAEISDKTANRGLDMQREIHDEDMARYMEMYNTVRNETAGQRALGQQSMGQLQGLLSEGGFLRDRFTGDDLENEPGYQFRLAEGQKGVNRSAAASGGLLSGAAMKALDRYSQDYASNEYQNAYNRFAGDQDRTYNMLMGTANLGAAASGAGTNLVNSMSQVNQAYGNNATGLITANGANQANYAIQQGNIQANRVMQPSGTARALGGAASGAATGAAFGPWGAVIGGVVGGLASML